MKISSIRVLPLIAVFPLIFLASCATEKETVSVPKVTPETKQPEIARLPEKPAPPREAACEEYTSKSINRSGIETMPFMRMTFSDIQANGVQDMIVGNKTGSVYLYRNSGSPVSSPWQLDGGYFSGVKAGAFSSPALGDFDGDGRAELIVGTGGFSSDSGKIFFFRNGGTVKAPSWKKMSDPVLSVGNDAAVTVVDYDFDGRPDIIACNSEGKIFFFRNVSAGGQLRFEKSATPPVRTVFGMYSVPAAKKIGDKVYLVVGNSMGRLFMFEISRNGSSRQLKLGITSKSFVSPAFANLLDKGRTDLVVADGDGVISYYENLSGDFGSLRKRDDLFNNRILAGPVCSPTIACIGSKTYMVIGNMDGTLRFFEKSQSSQSLPWTEKRGYLNGVRVQGFSRGILTVWEGREMLITGQGNGRLRAFMNMGKGGSPLWKEKAGFFQGVRIKEHSSPAIFDLDGSGKWQLVSGAVDGRLYAFRISGLKKGLPVWEQIDGAFSDIRVDGFSVPTIVRDENTVYLFVGQQDGRIRTFRASIGDKPASYRSLKFEETALLANVRMNEHSSPFVQLDHGMFDIISGDYNGNLRHFLCKKSLM